MTTWTEKVLPLGIDVDGDTKAASMEKNTLGLKVLESEHSEIWDGYAFKTFHIETISASASINICVCIPDTVAYAHIYHDVFRVSGGPFTTGIYEGATISATGSAKATININRLSLNTSRVVVAHNPGITNYGTQLDGDYLPSDKSTPTDNDGYAEHFVLGPGEHIFRASSNSNQLQTVIFRMAWFERWL